MKLPEVNGLWAGVYVRAGVPSGQEKDSLSENWDSLGEHQDSLGGIGADQAALRGSGQVL